MGSNPSRPTKVRSTLKINCHNCHKECEVSESEVKRGNGKFCSLGCSSKFNANTLEPNCICAYCSTPFRKPPSKIKRSKSGLTFCCREHKDAAQKIGGLIEIQPEHYGTGDGAYRYRKQALEAYESKCMRCGYNRYTQVLQVHHIDRDRKNNHIENLEVLCPTCHMEEHLIGSGESPK